MDSKSEFKKLMYFQNRMYRRSNFLMLVVSLIVNLLVLVGLNFVN